MGLMMMDGFDAYGTAATELSYRWLVTNSGTGLSLTQGRAGSDGLTPAGQSLRWAASEFTTKLKRNLSFIAISFSEARRLIVGFNFKVNSLPASSMQFFTFAEYDNSPNEDLGGLRLKSDGALEWLHSSGSTIRATTALTLSAGTWHHIEFEIAFETSGTHDINISIDGTNELFAAAGAAVADNTVQAFILGQDVAVGTMDIDDFYVIDPHDSVSPTARIGASQITSMLPDGDGNTTAWTLFGGASDWESIDDPFGTIHDGDTTYVSSQTAGQQSLFTVADLPADVSALDAVAVTYVAKKNGVGGKGFHPTRRTASTTAVGTLVAATPTGAYQGHQEFIATDGEDNTWTTTNFDSSEFGMEVEA